MNVQIAAPSMGVGFNPPVIRDGAEPYAGVYEVTPSTETQTLETTNKKLEQDVTVNPIPSGWYDTLKPGIVRPDAELVKTFTFDKNAVADLHLTIPAYTTTATVILDTSNLEQIAVDYNYRYFIVEKFSAIPTYNRADKLKGRVEYMVSTACYDFVLTPNDYYKSLDGLDSYSGWQIVAQANGAVTKQPYYSADDVFNVYASSTYGFGATPQAPSVSSGKMTVKTPKWQLRGSANYFTNTYWNALTDIRLQYVMEVWRHPVGSMGLNGWNSTQVLDHMVSCTQSTTHTLT